MGGYIPDEKIEEIRSRADILEIVSEFVTLRKRGKSYTGLCPFHGEKTPSFTVNVDRQIFHCFGCGEGGNVIRFLMKINNLSFPEAVRSLAAKVGVDLPEREFRKERKEPGKREKLLRANRLAAGYFRDALNGPEGDRARMYLTSRGIGVEALSRFSIGYARDGWHFLKDALGQQAVPADIAEEAGLLVRKDRDWHYDRFRDRIMFPVLDLNGNVVAFGGRLLGNGEPKYLNSPETPVYTKGRVLYGLYDTKEEIRRADRAILVEGYMDLIALWEGGIRHVVASLGTALTREQVLILRRFTKNVVLLFDPDQAGRHAAERSLKLFLEEGVHGWVLRLPDGYDPDAYIRTFGPERLNSLVGTAPSLTDYYIETIMGPGKTVEEKLEKARTALPLIGGMSDALQRTLLIRRISEYLGVSEDLLEKEARKRRPRKAPAGETAAPEAKREPLPDPLELSIIFCLMEHRDRWSPEDVKRLLPYFLDPRAKKLCLSWVEARQAGEADPGTFLENLGNAEIRGKYYGMMMGETPFGDDVADRVMEDMARRLKERWVRSRHGEIQRQLVEAQKKGDTERCHHLLEEKTRLLREEQT